MEKKKILFIIPSLDIGGGEKSLVNLLQTFDYNQYSVYLYTFKENGILAEFLPSQVQYVYCSSSLKKFQLSLLPSILEFLKDKEYHFAVNRLMYCVLSRIIKNRAIAEQKCWKYMKNVIGKIEGKYDVAIGYLEKSSNYCCIDCVQAEYKIGWVHTDYNKLKADRNFDLKYFDRFNTIVTVSEECGTILKENFEVCSNKITVIENIISNNLIEKLANQLVDLEVGANDLIIVSVGRLSYEKGFDLAIESAKRLREKNISFKWLVIGEGQERENLHEMIKNYNLSEYFSLIGADINPYKYIKRADIYIQPSRFEGKSIAIEEAKLLAKPIIVTNFSTVKNQIEDEVTGLIADMNATSITDAIIKLMDTDLRAKLNHNLEKVAISNIEEIEKLYQVIEND